MILPDNYKSYKIVCVATVEIEGRQKQVVLVSVGGRLKTSKSKTPFSNILKIMREIVLEECNHMCSACGSYADIVHHKDWTRYNHSIENLMPLCNSCHRKEHLTIG